MNTKEIVLKNGLKTLLLHAKGNSYATVQLWFRAGSALENEREKGIAHFLEHMFFKGTKKRPGNRIAYEIESFGGEINAFTSFDYTCYYINCPSLYIEKSAEVLLDMVTHPLFKNSDLLTEREVVYEEYLRSLDNNHQYAFQKMQEDLFVPPYSMPIIGTQKHIKSFSLPLIKKFRAKYYHAEHAMLVVAGDIKEEKKLITLLEKFKLPRGKESTPLPFLMKKKPSISIHTKDVNMEQLTLLFPASPIMSESAAIEDLVSSMLGHGERSRLYNDLVIDGEIANSASASIMFTREGGAHTIRMSYPSKNRRALLKKLQETLRKVIHNGFVEDELVRLKAQYLSSKIYEKESIESYAFSLGHSYAQTGDLHQEESFLDTIKGASLLQVNRTLRSIFTRPIHLAVQLPETEKLSLIRKELLEFQESLKLLSKTELESTAIKPIQISKFDSQVKLFDLSNGIKILYRQNRVTPTFVLQAYLRGGITEETEQNNGIYHLLTGLLTKGYDGKSYEEIKEELETCSASLGGFSGKNAYGISLHSLTEKIEKLLPHFFGSLSSPDITERFLVHEKELTTRSIEALKKDPVRICFRESQKILYGNHPYALDALGTEENLLKFSTDELKSLHLNNIKNKELLLTYCGDLDFNDLLMLLKPFLQNFSPKKNPPFVRKDVPRVFGEKRNINFDREQNHLFLSIPTGPLLEEVNVALKVVTTYLSGQSSPLFDEVRDKKGLCYSAQPVHYTALEGGHFGIYIATSPEKKDKAIEALKKILTEIKNGGISEAQFKRIKKMIEGTELVSIQTNDDYANLYSVPVLQDLGLDFYHQSHEKINKMSYAKFLKLISKVFTGDWNLVSVGPNTCK